MQNEEDGERYTLGLLIALRVCEEAANSQDSYAAKFHELLRSISSSNLPDVANELGFRVIGYHGRSRRQMRIISLNGNVTVGRAAYEAAVKLFPNDRWVLTWGSKIVLDSMPETVAEPFGE